MHWLTCWDTLELPVKSFWGVLVSSASRFGVVHCTRLIGASHFMFYDDVKGQDLVVRSYTYSTKLNKPIVKNKT